VNENQEAQDVATSEPITHIILACDESGAKGYADREELFPGETGVFAGLMVPSDYVAQVAPSFDAVAAKYATREGKLHITDLSPEHQGALRDEMFAVHSFSQIAHPRRFLALRSRGRSLCQSQRHVHLPVR
jgi:hypothetical protein